MSVIHIVDRKTDKILDDITDIDVIDNEHYKSIKDYVETFEFVALGGRDFAEHLGKRNKLIVPNEDGNGYHEFIMSEDVKIHDENYNEIEVLSDASYIELKKAKIIDAGAYEDLTPSMVLSIGLGDTGWQAGIVEVGGYATTEFSKDTNPFDFIKRFANEFEVEINFRVEIVGNRILGRYVDFISRIGTWQGVEVEFGHNLNGIRRLENTDNVVTALKGIGPENEEGERLTVVVKDNEALERWGIPDRNGVIRHLIEPYEIDSNDEDMPIEKVEQYTRTALNKRINSLVEYVANIHSLEHVPELEGYKIRFGDTIRIKDTKFNPPLYLEARIHSQKRDIFDKAKKQVTLGDYIEYTEEEITDIWRELQDEIRGKIGLYELLEHTYDKETIDWKDDIVLGDSKDYSTNVANQAEDNAKGHADDVAGQAEANAKDYAEEQADLAEQRALEKAVAKAVFESTIDEIMGDLVGKAEKSVVEDLEDIIAGKVDAEWVDGKLQGKVDQSEYDNKISDLLSDIGDKADLEYVDGKLVGKANADDVYVIEDIDSMFDNVVSITEYQTDMDGIVTELESHGTQISQNADEIGLRATKSDVNTLKNRVSDAETSITANADEIELRATKSEVNTLTGRVSDAETSITNNADEIALKANKSTVNSLTGDVEDLESTVTQHAGMIEDRVTKTVYNQDMNGIISDLESYDTRITQTETDISSKAERTALESLEDDVGGIETSINNAWTEINQNADEIALKASQSSVNNLSNEISDIDAELVLQAGKIASKVEQADFDSTTNTLGNKITSVEQDVDSITSEVSDVRADLDGLEIGGTNLLKNTSNEYKTVKHSVYYANVSGRVNLSDIGLKPGDNVTYSIYVKAHDDYGEKLRIRWHKNVNENHANSFGNEEIKAGKEGKLYLTATIPDETENFYLVLTGIPTGTEYTVEYKRLKLEEGNKATDWSPAPEDVASELSSHKTLIDQNADEIELRATKKEVNTLTGRVSSAETSISNNADQIALRATKTSVNSLTGRVSTAETSISSNATEIGLRVKENEVISAINLTSETAKIKASNIQLVGAVTVLSDITGDLGDITAGNISGVNITGATFTQDGNDGSIILNQQGFFKLDEDGYKRVSITNQNGDFQGFSAASIVLNEENINPFSIIAGGHGTGDAFLGFIEPESLATLNISNPKGPINLNATEISISDYHHTLKDNNGDFRIQSTGGYTAFASQYDNVHLQSPVGVHMNDWLSAARYTDLYTGTIRAKNSRVLDTSSETGTTYFHIRKNTMLGVYETDGTYIIDFRGNIGSSNNKSIRLNNINNYTTSASANLHVSGSNNVIKSTSAMKYKENIEPIEEWRAEQFFEEAEPVWFVGKGDGDTEKHSHYGYVADDIARFEPRLVDYNKNNEPEGFAYDRVPAMLHVVMRKDRKRLDDVARAVYDNADDIEILKIENRLLKKRVENLEKGA